MVEGDDDSDVSERPPSPGIPQCRSPGSPTLAMTLPGVDSRRWEDEVVYGIIIEKFCDGDPSNNFMRDRFIKDRARYEGGFWGGDLKGVIDKLDDLADLGVTAILLYPVMQNDEEPVGKFLPTGYRPKDYERVDRNFGDDATLRSLVDAAHARDMRVILDMPITLPGFEHPFVVDPAKKGWFGPSRASTGSVAGRSRTPRSRTI